MLSASKVCSVLQFAEPLVSQHGQTPADPDGDSDDDPRTSYEKKWDEQVKKQEQKAARSAAEKSHR